MHNVVYLNHNNRLSRKPEKVINLFTGNHVKLLCDYWNGASHLVDVLVTFRRRFDSAAAVGISVYQRLEFVGVHDTL